MLEVVNENIDFPKVFITQSDQKAMLYTRANALKMASEQNVDLYVISYNNDNIPICQLGNFNKYKYQLIKKHKLKLKKLASQNIVKRITMRANIDENDLQVKANRINHFLANNQKVKISLRLFGRQITNKDVFLGSFYDLIKLLKNCENKESVIKNIEQKRNLFEIVALPSKGKRKTL